LSLSSAARASLRYRTARALLMASQIPTDNKDSSIGKRFGSWAARRFRSALARVRPAFVFRSLPTLGSPQTEPALAGFTES
jgi:hypothetical protein